MTKSKLEQELLAEVRRYNAINSYTNKLLNEQVPPPPPEKEDPNAPPKPPAPGEDPMAAGAPGAGAPGAEGAVPPPPGGEVPLSGGEDLGGGDFGGGGGGGGMPPMGGADAPMPDAGAGADAGLDTGGAEEPSADDSTEEMDITDLVNMTKNIKQQLDNTKNDNSGVTQKMDDVFSKLGELEAKLGEMDQVLSKIDELGSKIQQMKPPTPVEKLEMRSLDSYPFNQKPEEFFDQKQGEMRASGKNEYVLTKDDIENYGRGEIMKSFNPEEEEENDEQEFQNSNY